MTDEEFENALTQIDDAANDALAASGVPVKIQSSFDDTLLITSCQKPEVTNYTVTSFALNPCIIRKDIIREAGRIAHKIAEQAMNEAKGEPKP